MKRTLQILLACAMISVPVTLPLAFSGCGTTAQSRTYKTIYSVQAATVSAYEAYLGEVIAGRVKTNGVPRVSDAFNKFQAATLVAVDLAQNDTNSPAPAKLSTLSADLLNLISQFSTK
jgi:hypothetical protein